MNTTFRIKQAVPVCLAMLILSLWVALMPSKAIAQATFVATNLPHFVGEYYYGYYSTNLDPHTILGKTNGPQIWDFSAGQQGGEAPHQFDLVSGDDSGYGFDFPDATYSERETDETTGEILAWSNYSMDSNAGRVYYGFIVSTHSVEGEVVFNNSTVDIPASVQFGQTWSRTVDYYYLDPINNAFKYVYFSDQSLVDAFGSVKLNTIGSRPALRVHEVHIEDDYDVFTGDFLFSLTNTYYYWLVPGIGIAGELTLFSQNPQLSSLPFTNAFMRTFATSLLTPVDRLSAHATNSFVRLTWTSQVGAMKYQVESCPDLLTGGWTVVALPVTNTYLDAIISSQRFYRVFSIK